MDNCDLDKMSLLELDDILKRVLKYGNRGRYYAKWEGNNDLLLIHTDSLMMKFFIQQFQKCRLVEVWVEHPISVVEKVNVEVSLDDESDKAVDEEGDEHLDEDGEENLDEEGEE